jgi:hypothetical protein
VRRRLRELARLSAETCARAEAGDEAFLDEAFERRHALLTGIAHTAVPADEAPEVRAAIGDVLALDEQLLTLLVSQRDAVRQELARIGERRTALQSYRGADPSGAVYVERLT